MRKGQDEVRCEYVWVGIFIWVVQLQFANHLSKTKLCQPRPPARDLPLPPRTLSPGRAGKPDGAVVDPFDLAAVAAGPVDVFARL